MPRPSARTRATSCCTATSAENRPITLTFIVRHPLRRRTPWRRRWRQPSRPCPIRVRRNPRQRQSQHPRVGRRLRPRRQPRQDRRGGQRRRRLSNSGSENKRNPWHAALDTAFNGRARPRPRRTRQTPYAAQPEQRTTLGPGCVSIRPPLPRGPLPPRGRQRRRGQAPLLPSTAAWSSPWPP